jgi:hydroxymethylpyrimidine pyrophosphatase-like HAD family hydrolase
MSFGNSQPGLSPKSNLGQAKSDSEVDAQLRDFLQKSQFCTTGAVMTDLDGTAVHEDRGRIYIPQPVELGLKALHSAGRPFILNSLRFPLSVLRTFGREWYSISNAPIPLVSLNGSLVGLVSKNPEGELIFEEIEANPITVPEIDEVLKGVKGLLDNGVKDILIFYYPRDWRMGEIIWTPVAENVMHVKQKYLSASSVTAVEFTKLCDQLTAEELCMIFLLLDLPQDQLMAYQHTKRSNFFTRKGVDKLFGAERASKHLNVDLGHSIGAGDTELDSFLSGVGLAVLVGNNNLEFKGLVGTIKIETAFQFGALLFRLAELQREHG